MINIKLHSTTIARLYMLPCNKSLYTRTVNLMYVVLGPDVRDGGDGRQGVGAFRGAPHAADAFGYQAHLSL